MAVDTESDKDYSPEALRERERTRRLDDAGADPLSAGELASLDQIEAGLRDNKDSSSDDGGWKTSVGDEGESPGRLRRAGKFLARNKKKGGIVGGVAGLGIAGTLGIFSILQGPFQLIHLSNVLSLTHFSRNSDTFDISTRRLYNTLSGQSEKNRLNARASRLVNKHRARMEAKGIKLSYETESGAHRSKLQAIEIDTNTPEGKSLLNRVRSQGINIDIPQNGRVVIRGELRGREGGKLARSLADGMVDLEDMGRVRSALASRRLKKIMGADFSARSVSRRSGEDLADYNKRRQDERGKEAEKGRSTKEVGNPISEPDSVDAPAPELDPEDVDVGKAAGDTVKDLRDTPSPSEKRLKLKTIRNSNLFKAGATAAAVIAVTCAVKDIGSNIPEYKMLNVVMPIVRLTAQYMAGGARAQIGETDLAEIGSYTEMLYEEDTVLSDGTVIKGSGSVMAAALIKNSVGEPGGVMPDGATASQITSAYKGDKPSVFKALDAIPLLGTACKANDWFGNLPGIKQFGEVSNKIVSGLSSAVTGKSIEDWMGDFVAMLSGGAIDTVARGGTLGNLLSFGGRMAANATAVAAGGVELALDQVSAWNDRSQEMRLARKHNQSLSERLFDMNAVDSLASTLAMRLVGSSGFRNFGNLIQTGPLQLLSGLGSGIGSIFGATTSAQSDEELYGDLRPVGVPLELLEAERYADTYVNIDRFTDPASPDFVMNLSEANDNWGHCFGNPIDDQGRIVDKMADGNYQRNISSEECKNLGRGTSLGDAATGEQQQFNDYLMFVHDASNITINTCLDSEVEGSAEACAELGMAASSDSRSETPNTGASAAYIPDCTVNNGNAKIACVAIDTMLGIPYRNNYSTIAGCVRQPSASNDPNPVALDCSAFVSMAVYRAFGTDAPRTSVDYLSHPNFEVVGDTRGRQVGDIRDIQPGDLVGRGDCGSGAGGRCNGHIGIVVSYDRTTGELVTVETDSCRKLSRVETEKGLAIDGRGGIYTWAVRYTGTQGSPGEAN